MGWGHSRPFSDHEIEVIRRYWLVLTLKQLAQRLGRSAPGIANQAKRIGLPPKIPPQRKGKQ